MRPSALPPPLAANLDAAPRPAAVADARLAKAAEAFEAAMLRDMLAQMRSSTRALAGEDSVFADRVNGDMQDFADAAVAEQLASQRVFGIANALLAQLAPAPAFKSPPATVASVQTGAGAVPAALAAFAAPHRPRQPD